MSQKRRIALVLFFVFGMIALPMILFGGKEPTSEALAERAAASLPSWNSYQEDIKGQIGARPVAEWSGHLLAATQSEDSLRLTFELTGPWKHRDAALPVLLRLPDATILAPRDASQAGEPRVYHYTLPASASIPWAEVQYPHHRERIYFDAVGQWTAKTN